VLTISNEIFPRKNVIQMLVETAILTENSMVFSQFDYENKIVHELPFPNAALPPSPTV
jgi:hypothetical protein